MNIVPRSTWGARHERGAGPAPLPAQYVYLHHSVTIAPDLLPPFDDEYAAMRTLEQIGESRFGRGISYTFGIVPTGNVYEGHGVETLGAHTAKLNSAARAIVFIGNYDVNRPTAAMIESAAQLLVHGKRVGWWLHARLTGGHRDAPGASTACPGRFAYDVIDDINARAAAIEAGRGTPTIPEDDMPGFNDSIEWKRPDGQLVKFTFAQWLVWANWYASAAASQAEANGKQIAALTAAVDKLAGAVASGRDDLTAAELREAVAGAIADAGAALRAVEVGGPSGTVEAGTQ